MKRTADEYAVLLRLLDEALDLPIEARGDWVDQLSGLHAELRPTLRRLLLAKSAPETGDVIDLQSYVAAVVRDAAAQPETHPLRAGEHVGPYELVREIGRGGMGFVWLANRADGTFRRSVALKLPHVTWAGSLGARMVRERDILAGLEHPNIARLYDAGVDAQGRPFMAMEYVEGQTIDVHCSERQLSIRERLALVLDVAKAVAYAHSKLVVHRDLKPANMLVTAGGAVRLLDFGIAKLIEGETVNEARLTQLSGRLLTPDYASPEQIRGEAIGTATDVYSLAVVTYELLTGARPYRLKRQSAVELEEAIAEVDPRLASEAVDDRSRRRQLRGDLDAILNKAMKKSPTERYSTVDAFSGDLRRYLAGETVLAQPDRAAYRMRKFLLRHHWQSASAAIAVIALLAGSGLALWQARAARLEAARAELVKSFALSLLDSADSDAGAGVATTAVDLLQAARKRVETELAGRPAVAAELMTAIGYGLIGQDRAEDAVSLLKKAIELSSQANGAEDPRTVEAQVVYGEALYDLGKNDEAIALLKPTVERAHRVRDNHAEIDAWRWLSSAQIDAGQTDSAIASARAAVAAIAPTGKNPDQRTLLDAMQAHLALANALSNTLKPGVVEEARSALRYTAQMDKTLEPTAALDARTLLGMGLISDGRPVEGLRELKSAYADSRKFRGADHVHTTIVAGLLGKYSLEAGDVPGALTAYQESFDAVMRRQDARGPFAVAMVHYGLAQALAAAGDHERALPHFGEAARLFAQTNGSTAPFVLRSRSAHALSVARLGRLAESEREFRSLAAMPFAGPDEPAHQGRLAVLRSLQGQHEEAVTLAKASADGLKEFPSKSTRAQSLSRLGSILLAANRRNEAMAPLQQSIALFNEAQVPESPERAEAMAMLNQVRTSLNQ
jgi:eukaryotic-like serine/threonine-protein kinase